MQGGAITPRRAERGGCGGSLEGEPCLNEIGKWTLEAPDRLLAKAP